ncbi:MAG TPA: arylsulfatase [Polyangiaceae bacterium]|nr:arylsulfatase [Polyangiaceae bacterium]
MVKHRIVVLVGLVLASACNNAADNKQGGEQAAPQQAAPQEAPATPQAPQETALQRIAKPSKEALVKTADVVEQGKKKPPNILIIMGDDIGYWNVSAHSHGMMGFTTPNIDRIANEGMLFTDSYGENSCTAGRAAFITGQLPFRVGLTKVGLPGADVGLNKGDPTIADLLKPLGYRTGQFGKNHLGDKDEFLPTNHGFDEFFGNLYHLNAEEEPEQPDYPKDPNFKKRFGPRGVIHSKADGKIEDTGPLTRKRMETIDEETLKATKAFIGETHKENKPFFVWFNSTRMHIFTHLKPASEGKTGFGQQADGMVEHDGMVGELLNLLDELKITDDTIVIYTTDNGAEMMSWPDAGITPFRGEKDTTWEGGFRVPLMIRWPKKVPSGVISNDIISNLDWLPTLVAAAGVPDVKEKLLKGYQAGGKNFKVHLDGYNQLDHILGNAPSARKEFFYFNDDGELCAVRNDRFKFHFQVQTGKGFEVWRKEFDKLRVPQMVDLRADPFERGWEEGYGGTLWALQHVFMLVPTQVVVKQFVDTLKDFPPRGKAASFSVDQILAAAAAKPGAQPTK